MYKVDLSLIIINYRLNFNISQLARYDVYAYYNIKKNMNSKNNAETRKTTTINEYLFFTVELKLVFVFTRSNIFCDLKLIAYIKRKLL